MRSPRGRATASTYAIRRYACSQRSLRAAVLPTSGLTWARRHADGEAGRLQMSEIARQRPCLGICSLAVPV